MEDGDALATVFEQLGFTAAFTYEKWRTEWADDAGHCVIDETPIGLYAELEGPSGWIDHIAKKLGVEHSEFLTLSYGRLFEVWQQETGSDARDLTFEAVSAAAAPR